MPFTKVVNRVPTSIGRLEVILRSEADGTKSALYQLKVLDQDGQRIPYSGDSGDLTPYLTPAQITALIGFMDSLRTQATTEIIGSGLK